MTDEENDTTAFTLLITHKGEFEAGDEGALLRAIYWAFLHNRPVPDWARIAFLSQYMRGRHGEIKSWDEAFGRPARYGTGRRILRQMKDEKKVLEEVARLKSEGHSLNEEAFIAIAKSTAVGGKSKVKALLRDAKMWAERLNALYRRH